MFCALLTKIIKIGYSKVVIDYFYRVGTCQESAYLRGENMTSIHRDCAVFHT